MLFSSEAWNARYKERDTPWDANEPDLSLVQLVENQVVLPCDALDIGCGTANETIFLAQHGFTVTGIDLSQHAITTARSKSQSAGVTPTLLCGDFLTTELKGSYQLVLDRRVFHFFDPQERITYVERVNALLGTNGLFILDVSSSQEMGNNRYHFSSDDLLRIFSATFSLQFLELITLQAHKEKPKTWVSIWKSRK